MGPGCTLSQITAPLLRTAVISTWCFVFIGVVRELSATVMLTTAPTKLVSVIIYDFNQSGDFGASRSSASSFLVITFAVVIAVNRIPGFGDARLRNT